MSSDGERHIETRIKQFGLPEPMREFQFDPMRKWRFDFAWPSLRIAVEVQGGTWSAGRHTRGPGYEADCEKSNTASIAGWIVLRFTTEMVTDDRAIDVIKRAHHKRRRLLKLGWTPDD